MLNIDTIVAEVEALANEVQGELDKYEEITGTQIPSSLKSALDQKWELAFNAVQIGLIIEYPEAEQDEDGRRVIKVERALKLIEQFEQDLVRETTQGVFGSLVRQLNACVDFGYAAFETAFTLGAAFVAFNDTIPWKLLILSPLKALQALFDLIVAFGLFFTIFLIRMTLDGARVSKWVLGTTKIMKARDAASAKVRGAAFPQRAGRRYVRRKVSRR